MWKLEDAKTHFSEVVRRARSEGQQHVTLRGKQAVVVIATVEHDRLSAAAPALPLVAYLQSLHVDGLDLVREADAGRDFSL